MRWEKIGKVFDPSEHKLPLGCSLFAKGPQAMVMDDFVRVYFSACKQDTCGKYLSHICYADFSRDFRKIMDISRMEVIPLGELGCFDEHGLFPIHIFRDGHQVWAFTTGWSRRVSVSAEASIGLAVSTDGGQSFQKVGNGPILASSLNEPFLIGDPFVLKVDGIYNMWYIFGQRWIEDAKSTQPERVYKIAHAISYDGLRWERNAKPVIPDFIGLDECQALPSVMENNGIFHMVFCYRDAVGFRSDKGKGYRLGYAFSKNLLNWTRDDDILGLPLFGTGWDGQMMCYPHLFKNGNQICLLYNGNEFGKDGFGLAVLQSDINEHVK
jgi:hypothetical protein